MLFNYIRSDEVLLRALRAAVAAHRPSAVAAFLAGHGERSFAKTLASCSGRIIADALSMLPVLKRSGVLRHLPRAARRRLRAAGGDLLEAVEQPVRGLPLLRAVQGVASTQEPPHGAY